MPAVELIDQIAFDLTVTDDLLQSLIAGVDTCP